jgi:hypothetical protein
MNKTFFLKGISIIAFVCGIAFNYYLNVKNDHLSDVVLANIEMLAQAESGDGSQKICYFPGTSNYADYYACQSGYPEVKTCNNTNREYMYFSADKHACNY